MTFKQRRALACYVREAADMLMLADTELMLLWDAPEDSDDAAGWCSPNYGKRRASLWFAPDLPEWDPEEQVHVVAHELVHVLFAPLDHPLQVAKDHMAPGAAEAWEAHAREGLEHGVDATSWFLARNLPHINWTAKPGSWIPRSKGTNWLLRSRHHLDRCG